VPEEGREEVKTAAVILEEKESKGQEVLRNPKSCRGCIMSLSATSPVGTRTLYCRFDGRPEMQEIGPVESWKKAGKFPSWCQREWIGIYKGYPEDDLEDDES
jgi:metal-dependent amidase/aminoacylase/carboxypeptidase family protein